MQAMDRGNQTGVFEHLKEIRVNARFSSGVETRGWLVEEHEATPRCSEHATRQGDTGPLTAGPVRGALGQWRLQAGTGRLNEISSAGGRERRSEFSRARRAGHRLAQGQIFRQRAFIELGVLRYQGCVRSQERG